MKPYVYTHLMLGFALLIIISHWGQYCSVRKCFIMQLWQTAAAALSNVGRDGVAFPKEKGWEEKKTETELISVSVLREIQGTSNRRNQSMAKNTHCSSSTQHCKH